MKWSWAQPKKSSEVHVLTNHSKTQFIALDLHFYRKKYPDLASLSDDQLRDHYAMHGYREGRAANNNALRENFFNISKDVKCLEIGLFYAPVVRGENVKYLDILSREELVKRAREHSVSEDQILDIPNIEFVSEDGSLTLINEKFDLVISSHNLEHQPDLVEHLNQVSNILFGNGRYKMAVPNCAYCFDANLYPSKISEVIFANRTNQRTHSIAKVIEHHALTTHNETKLHWKRSLCQCVDYTPIDVKRVSEAIDLFDEAKGEYIDVHSWQFLPHTLTDILRTLIALKYIAFREVLCYGPVTDRNEFCIELVK